MPFTRPRDCTAIRTQPSSVRNNSKRNAESGRRGGGRCGGIGIRNGGIWKSNRMDRDNRKLPPQLVPEKRAPRCLEWVALPEDVGIGAGSPRSRHTHQQSTARRFARHPTQRRKGDTFRTAALPGHLDRVWRRLICPSDTERMRRGNVHRSRNAQNSTTADGRGAGVRLTSRTGCPTHHFASDPPRSM